MAKEYTEEELYEMSDDELESAVKALRTESFEDNEDNNDNIPNQGDKDGLQEEKEEDLDSIKESEPSSKSDTQEEEDSSVTEEEPTSQRYKVKANGMEYDFDVDELLKLAPKALDYTKKTQYIAPYRKVISAMEDNGISQEDINLFIDMKKGDKNAIAKFLDTTQIDSFDLPSKEEINYTPNNYTKELAPVDELLNSIGSERVYTKTSNAIKSFDKASIDMLNNTPEYLQGLQEDIDSGIYDAVMPNAHKMAVLDNFRKPMLAYYAEAGQEYYESLAKQAQSEAESKKMRETTRKSNRQKAGIPSNVGETVKSDINSYMDISDEEFWKWRKSIDNK